VTEKFADAVSLESGKRRETFSGWQGKNAQPASAPYRLRRGESRPTPNPTSELKKKRKRSTVFRREPRRRRKLIDGETRKLRSQWFSLATWLVAPISLSTDGLYPWRANIPADFAARRKSVFNRLNALIRQSNQSLENTRPLGGLVAHVAPIVVISSLPFFSTGQTLPDLLAQERPGPQAPKRVSNWPASSRNLNKLFYPEPSHVEYTLLITPSPRNPFKIRF